MNCSACEARLGAYLDAAASASDARAIEEHLSGCAACTSLAADLRAVESALSGLQPIEPRADLTIAVMAAVAAMPVPKPTRLRARWFIGYLSVAWAVLIALVATGILNWQRIVAGGATEFGKILAGVGTLGHVALSSNLHVPAIAGAAFGIECVVVAAGALTLRHMLPRLSGWLAGAQTI